MEKIKKVIFTFTGECRPAKQGESFFDNGLYRTWNNGFSTTDSYNICTLEEIEEVWKPEMDEQYYYVCTSLNILGKNRWVNDGTDNSRLKLGNIFRTRESAESKLKEIKEILLK